jgi:hypothetical protein
VKQVSDLHVKDESNVSQMRDILTRSFYNDESNNEGEEGEGQIDEEVNGNQVNLTDEELMKLAACGLSLDVDSDHACDPSERLAQEEQLLQSLPLHLKLKFEQAVQRGELSHLVQNFHPFWLPKYNCDGDDMNENGRDFDGQLVSQPIDERILAIPPLPRLDSSLDSSLYSKSAFSHKAITIYIVGSDNNIIKSGFHLPSKKPVYKIILAKSITPTPLFIDSNKLLATSGLKTELDNFKFSMEQSEEGYRNFTVIQCKIKSMEWLYLAAKGHRRARFELYNNKEYWLIP